MSKIWGPSCWYLFHGLASKVKEEDFEKIKLSLWTNIVEICNNLPCPDCRKHAMDTISRTNKQNILKCKRNLELFLFDFHNIVNARKGYKILTIEEYDSMYQKANVQMIVYNFINVFNQSTKNSRLMTETLHRQLFMNNFIKWININKNSFA
jgi:hypothetical protein